MGEGAARISMRKRKYFWTATTTKKVTLQNKINNSFNIRSCVVQDLGDYPSYTKRQICAGLSPTGQTEQSKYRLADLMLWIAK